MNRNMIALLIVIAFGVALVFLAFGADNARWTSRQVDQSDTSTGSNSPPSIENFPTIAPRPTLRAASAEDIAEFWARSIEANSDPSVEIDVVYAIDVPSNSLEPLGIDPLEMNDPSVPLVGMILDVSPPEASKYRYTMVIMDRDDGVIKTAQASTIELLKTQLP